MTRTVFLCHSAAPSGAELSLVRSLQRWERTDDAVVVFGEDGPLVDSCRASGIESVVHRLPGAVTKTRRTGGLAAKLRAVIGLVRYSRSLAAVLESKEPDVVVARSLKALIYGSMTAKRLQRPLVWSVHDRLSSEYMGRLASLFYGRVAPLICKALIVNSHATLETLTPGRRPVLVLPPGVHLDERHARPPGSPLKRIVVLGRLAPWKGQDLAVRAFESVLAGTDVMLDIVGGPLFGEEHFERELHDLAERSACPGQIRFHGHQSDPYHYLADADVMVHSSRIPEPFGAVVIEGLWANCVVIASTPGGPAEVIENGVTGILVPCGDLSELQRACSNVAGWSTERLREVAAKGRLRARDYDAERLARVMEAWLKDVADGEMAQVVVSAVPGEKSK